MLPPRSGNAGETGMKEGKAILDVCVNIPSSKPALNWQWESATRHLSASYSVSKWPACAIMFSNVFHCCLPKDSAGQADTQNSSLIGPD